MPRVDIDVLEGTTEDQRTAVSDAVHAAMHRVLGTVPEHRFHVFHEIPVTHLRRDEVHGLPRGPRTVFLTFLIAPRPPETIDALQRAAVEELGTGAGLTPDEIATVVMVTPGENWWWSGKPAVYGAAV